MGYKDVFQMSDETIMSMLFEKLYAEPGLRRKELIERCIDTLGFSAAERADASTSSAVTRAKSRIGMVLSACLKSGTVTEGEETGRLLLVGNGRRFISRERARDYVVSLLEQHGTLSKKQIYAMAERDFGTAATPDPKDDRDLRAALGKVISRLEEEKHIVRTARGFCLTSDRRYPNTEMGSCLREAAHGGDIKKCFLDAVHIRGGEWFESYCVELLEDFYRLENKKILSAAVTGGSDDGGIDGVITTEDWLGYRERVLMQMKNRRAVMMQKDIREFYGAVCAEHGTRGVFITISTFHAEAEKLIDRVDNLIGINGDKLFEIASLCGRGIVKTENGIALDEEMFLAE